MPYRNVFKFRTYLCYEHAERTSKILDTSNRNNYLHSAQRGVHNMVLSRKFVLSNSL